MAQSLEFPDSSDRGQLPTPQLRLATEGLDIPVQRDAAEQASEGERRLRLQIRLRRATQRARANRVAQHEEFQLVRSCALLMDAFVAVVLGAVALVTEQLAVGIIAATWLCICCLMAERSGRVADLVDQRPYVKLGANFLLVTTVLAASLGNVQHVRMWMAAAAVPALATIGTRALMARPTVRRALGSRAGESVIVVGAAEDVARTIREWRELPLVRVVGACLSVSDSPPDAIEGVPVLGTVDDVPDLTRRMPIDIVAVHDVDQLGGLQLAKLSWRLEETGTQVSVITPLTNTSLERLHVRRLGRRLIVDVSRSRPTGVVASLKCGVERVAAMLMLVVAAPVIMASAAAVAVTSPGPVIFRQTRVREAGGTFTMYKLRTMHQDAEARLTELMALNEVGGGLFKMKDDPRVTSVGKWLRKLSIDELPQLWNVVKGDMSLIGPRPALPREVETYDEAARRRLAVKPGLTGLWQVSGRSGLSWDESVRIDTDYVDNWRATRDVSIAFRTIRAVLKRDGAH